MTGNNDKWARAQYPEFDFARTVAAGPVGDLAYSRREVLGRLLGFRCRGRFGRARRLYREALRPADAIGRAIGSPRRQGAPRQRLRDARRARPDLRLARPSHRGPPY